MSEWSSVQDIIDELQGTCQSLSWDMDRFLEEHNGYEEIDEQIFLCDICGWWCEVGEEADEQPMGEMICQECADDE